MSTTDDYQDSGRYSRADQQRRLAQLLAAQGSSTDPIASPWQGAARLAQALAGVLGNRAANKREAAQQEALIQQIAGGLGMLGGGGGGATVPDTGPATTGSISGGGAGGGDIAAGAGDVYQMWLDRGLNPAQAATATASMQQESNFNPNAYNAREGAIGGFQWRGPRATGLKAFAQASGKPWNDLGTQMDYAKSEWEGSERSAGQAFLAARTPEEANQALKQYIRYGDKAGPAGSAGWDYRKRLGNTQRILQQQSGGGETAALPGVQPIAAAPSPDVMKFLGGGGQQTQPAGLSIGPPDAPIPRPRPPVADAAPATLDQRMNAGGGVTAPIDPRIAAAAQRAVPRQPQPRPAPPPAMLPLQPPAAQPVSPPPAPGVPAPSIQPPAAQVARVPVPRPAPAVASPVVPPAVGPATTGAIPQQRGQIFREPYPSVLSAQEFARQGQNYLTGRPSFADQQRVAPRTMRGGPAAPAAAVPASPRQGLIQRLFGGGGGGGAASTQGVPAGSSVAGAGQPVDARRLALIRILANPNAPAALRTLAAQELNPKPRDPMNVPAGGTVYDPNTNKAVFTAPEKPGDQYRPMTDAEKASYGIPPDDPKRYEINTRTNEVKPIGGAGINNIIGAGETEYSKTRGKALATRFETIQANADQAQSKMATLDAMEQALGKTDYTGWGAPQLLEVKRAAKLFGIDTGDTGAAETAQAISNQLAMQLRNPSGGAGMPGAMSDADRNFLKASVLGIERTPGGNAQLLDYNRRLAQRDIEVAQQAADYAAAHGGMLDDGFGAELAKWSKANPLFPEAKRDTPMPQGTGASDDPLGIR